MTGQSLELWSQSYTIFCGILLPPSLILPHHHHQKKPQINTFFVSECFCYWIRFCPLTFSWLHFSFNWAFCMPFCEFSLNQRHKRCNSFCLIWQRTLRKISSHANTEQLIKWTEKPSGAVFREPNNLRNRMWGVWGEQPRVGILPHFKASTLKSKTIWNKNSSLTFTLMF